MYLQNFLFLDVDSTTTTSNPLIVNSKAVSLKLSVEAEGTLDISVQGKVDRDSSSFFDLAIIDLSDFSKIETITEEGLYVVDVQGIKEIQVVNNDSATAVKVLGVVVD